MSNARTLAEHAGHNRCLDIELANGDGYSGFVVAVSQNLVLIKVIDGWSADGFMVAPLHHVTAALWGEEQEERTRVMTWNGVRHDAGLPNVDIGTIRTFLISAKLGGHAVFVSDGGDIEVGRVARVGQTEFALRAVDGAGEWIPEEVALAFAEVQFVSFDAEYETVLLRFAEAQGAEAG